MRLMNSVLQFLRTEDGAELAEYAVGIALLVAISLIVYKLLGNAINDQNNGTAAKVGTASNFVY